MGNIERENDTEIKNKNLFVSIKCILHETVWNRINLDSFFFYTSRPRYRFG